jgi:integrase
LTELGRQRLRGDRDQLVEAADGCVNPRVVMETLGHSQVSLTLNTYSHVLPALQREAAAKMNALFAES